MEVVVEILMAGRDMRAFPGVGNFLYFELGNGFIDTHLCRNLLQCSCYLTKKEVKNLFGSHKKATPTKLSKTSFFQPSTILPENGTNKEHSQIHFMGQYNLHDETRPGKNEEVKV